MQKTRNNKYSKTKKEEKKIRIEQTSQSLIEQSISTR